MMSKSSSFLLLAKWVREWSFLILSPAFLNACTGKSDRIKPRLTSITEAVYASANVKATDQYPVFPTVSGVLRKIYIKPGEEVKRHQLLFVLDDNTASLNTESAKASLELQRENARENSARLNELKAQVKEAYDKFRLDSSLYIRQKRLWDQRIGSQLDYDQRRYAYQSSASHYRALKNQYKQLTLQLANDLKKARLGYDINKQLEANYRIQSVIDGKVFDITVDEGELVTTQTQLAVIGRSETFLLEMQVDENDIAKVQLGQLVEITMDSYPGKVFEGRVERIFPLLNERSRTFRVEASFIDPPALLYPNLSAEANIVIRRKSRALIIPREYLTRDNYVYTSESEKEKVRTGLQDYEKVEILSGLDTGSFIYKPPGK